ncbi:hypothetical protein PR002_g24439 [Phytophthora rubi]|uniref:RxLR effector protein n=1 Tax=Phytophthora rubi TaxID=129364 RepID=A0A6A3IFX6_9STRA|nr:hypothetical protein PR002_g24439 [Phytophthora rubi]
MVLSVKKTLVLALCASTLSGIHHTTKYAPKESYDSYASYDLDGSDSADVSLEGSEDLDISSSQSLELDYSGDGDLDVDLGPGEGLDYSADGDQDLDLSSSGDLDFSADASLDASGELETQFEDGSVDLELDDSEQELEFEDDEVVDEVIEVPEGAKSIRLRVNNGNVDLDIIKGAKPHAKKAAAQPEPKKEEAAAQPEEKKEEAATAPTETKEESVSLAAEAKEWLNDNRQNGALIGSIRRRHRRGAAALG